MVTTSVMTLLIGYWQTKTITHYVKCMYRLNEY